MYFIKGRDCLIQLIALKMPRKRTRQELLATIQFALLMNFVTDLYLDLKYKLYWYFDKKQIEWVVPSCSPW